MFYYQRPEGETILLFLNKALYLIDLFVWGHVLGSKFFFFITMRVKQCRQIRMVDARAR